MSLISGCLSKKPLLFGGAAMEYYQLRSAGKDIDFLFTPEDFFRLAAWYPEQVAGERIVLGTLECWRQVRGCTYEQLEEGALETRYYRVLTREKLLLLKALAVDQEKNQHDIFLLAKQIQKHLQQEQ
ncbi:MAG: hypothetical protein J2P37_30300 [Ktedonobacteraceae bacterium]|nr:hypothetical protein [Ktedonobacteraceae bacterium]